MKPDIIPVLEKKVQTYKKSIREKCSLAVNKKNRKSAFYFAHTNLNYYTRRLVRQLESIRRNNSKCITPWGII